MDLFTLLVTSATTPVDLEKFNGADIRNQVAEFFSNPIPGLQNAC
jgi:hypothetical protein